MCVFWAVRALIASGCFGRVEVLHGMYLNNNVSPHTHTHMRARQCPGTARPGPPCVRHPFSTTVVPFGASGPRLALCGPQWHSGPRCTAAMHAAQRRGSQGWPATPCPRCRSASRPSFRQVHSSQQSSAVTDSKLWRETAWQKSSPHSMKCPAITPLN